MFLKKIVTRESVDCSEHVGSDQGEVGEEVEDEGAVEDPHSLVNKSGEEVSTISFSLTNLWVPEMTSMHFDRELLDFTKDAVLSRECVVVEIVNFSD